jgi:hypothetical protein
MRIIEKYKRVLSVRGPAYLQKKLKLAYPSIMNIAYERHGLTVENVKIIEKEYENVK